MDSQEEIDMPEFDDTCQGEDPKNKCRGSHQTLSDENHLAPVKLNRQSPHQIMKTRWLGLGGSNQ